MRQAAREVFRHVKVEILILDVNLPGITGLELLPLLRGDPHWNEPPIILMSAEPDQPQILDAVAAGQVTTFIQKPFDVDELVRRIEGIISEV